MVRATVSKPRNGTNHKKASDSQPPSSAAGNKTDSSILSTIAHFSRLQPFKATSFKKTVRSVLHPRKTSHLFSAHTQQHSEGDKDRDDIFAFTQLYRNTSRSNARLTKFKSKLIDQPRAHSATTNSNDEKSNGDSSSSNSNGTATMQAAKKKTKKVRRANRRNRLKQQIDTKTIWKMADKDETGNTSTTDDHQAMNGDGPHRKGTDGQCMNVSSMLQSLQEAESEIAEQKQQKTNTCKRRDVEVDRANLVQLFKNDMFDSDPCKFTKQILKQQAEAVTLTTFNTSSANTHRQGKNGKMHAQQQQQQRKKKNGFHSTQPLNGNAQKREQTQDNGKRNGSAKASNGHQEMNGDRGVRLNGNRNGKNGEKQQQSKLSDEELKKQICKQLALMKTKKQQSASNRQQQKAALKSSAASKLTFSKNGKLKHSKHGKFIHKKLKKKMSQIDKEMQKKRRWRVK